MFEYIFTIGCFDKFHKGHIELLESMKEKTDKIIVGLHDNNSIEKLKNISDIDSYDNRKKNLEKYAYDVFKIDNVDPTKTIKEYILNNFNQDLQPITIGPSQTNSKVIKSDYTGNLFFIHKYKDTFKYHCKNNNITVTRSDNNCGWGQNLIGYKKNWCFMRGDDNQNFPAIDYIKNIMPILNTVSVKQCADNFERVFLNKKTNKKEYKLLTCANQNYFNALKQFINNVKKVNIDFDNFIVYDIGLTSDQENELYILQAEYGFNIYKLDFSKYPEHVNLNLEKWSGLNNSYAFKPIIIHKVLQNINVPLIYMDCGCGFTNDTINRILGNLSKNHFYIPIANNKNSIESLELNHPDTLKHFAIKNTEIITCSANFLGINYENNMAKKIINNWHECSLNSEIIVPKGSNRNNHRQDQTLLSCILHNNRYNYFSNINVPFSPWKNKGSNTYYNKYKSFSCTKKFTNQYESSIYTNSLEEAIECYKNRKNISKEQLLKDFIVQ